MVTTTPRNVGVLKRILGSPVTLHTLLRQSPITDSVMEPQFRRVSRPLGSTASSNVRNSGSMSASTCFDRKLPAIMFLKPSSESCFAIRMSRPLSLSLLPMPHCSPSRAA